MLPGTWAYVSAGAIGRAFIVGSYLFSIHTFFVIFFVFKSAFNTICFCYMVQGLACFHRAHRTVFQNQQSLLYVSGLEETLRIWDEINGFTCCGILQNGITIPFGECSQVDEDQHTDLNNSFYIEIDTKHIHQWDMSNLMVCQVFSLQFSHSPFSCCIEARNRSRVSWRPWAALDLGNWVGCNYLRSILCNTFGQGYLPSCLIFLSCMSLEPFLKQILL